MGLTEKRRDRAGLTQRQAVWRPVDILNPCLSPRLRDASHDVSQRDTGQRRRRTAALASAPIFFARQPGGMIVAEGMEIASELSALRGLGVDMGQGCFFSQHVPIEKTLATAMETRLRQLAS
ncbi:MAG: EAL domain-containing protein [Bosea sp.]|nr:EAL domain-containing protein [Bosea sp. (in: a-proteobacteria)]